MKVVTPLVLFTLGLEKMTNAALQRGRLAEGFCDAAGCCEEAIEPAPASERDLNVCSWRVQW